MEEEPEGSGLASEPAPPQPGQAGAASNAGSVIAADAAPRASKTRWFAEVNRAAWPCITPY